MWVVKLEKLVDGTSVSGRPVAELNLPRELETLDDLGMTLDDGKANLAALQQAVIDDQVDTDTGVRRWCGECGRRCRIKDYRSRTIDTVFGRSRIRSARLKCPG